METQRNELVGKDLRNSFSSSTNNSNSHCINPNAVGNDSDYMVCSLDDCNMVTGDTLTSEGSFVCVTPTRASVNKLSPSHTSSSDLSPSTVLSCTPTSSKPYEFSEYSRVFAQSDDSTTNRVGEPAPVLSVLRSFEITTDGASFYQQFFVGTRFDCYRLIIPWFERFSEPAACVLKNTLPLYGPIVSRDLGFLLSQLVYFYDLKFLQLPKLFSTLISGKKFLHFECSGVDDIHVTISKLLMFDGFVGASIDPMAMIDTAANVGASTIAANECSMAFRDILNAMVKVDTALTTEEQNIIRKERRLVWFRNNSQIGTDHSLMAAYREIIRKDFDKILNLNTTNLRTLVLGASSREYTAYNNNLHVFFQFALREAKDADRTVINCLSALRKIKQKGISKKLSNPISIKRSMDGLKTIDEMMSEWRASRKVPERFLLWDDTQKMLNDNDCSYAFDQLVFQDVGYNFTVEDWGDLFRSTGAISAFGYMCLPWELLNADIVSPPGYVFKTIGDESCLAYHGYSNGYSHKTRAWQTLMVNPVMRFHDFSIGVEFMSRIGPMTCIRLFKTHNPERFVRNLELPEFLRTTRLLNIKKSYDREKGHLMLDKLEYFAVRSDEFQDAVNYGLDIAKDSVNFNNILLFIRRRCAGVSMVNKEMSRNWTAPKGLLPDFAMVVYLYVVHLCSDYIKFQAATEGRLNSKFITDIKRVVNTCLDVFTDIYDYFKSRDLFHLLVKDVKDSYWQDVVVTRFSQHGANNVVVDLSGEDHIDPKPNMVENEDRDDEDVCDMCEQLVEVCGEQFFTCPRDKDEHFYHDFALTTGEVTTLRTRLKDHTGITGEGLIKLKESALKRTPPSAFSVTAKVQYLCGPPGTGKSHLIRALATKDDLVIAPFTRLKDDYTKFEHPITGEVTSLNFATQHQAMLALNHSRIFVDEYTAFPYEILCVIVNNCATHEVFLVGDHRQTSLINEVEGISIASKIPIHKIREHELIKNFRNPSDAVFVLNNVFSYSMLATNDRVGFSFDSTSRYDAYTEHTPLFFCHATAKKFGVSSNTAEKVTVRANQGATYDKVKLVVTKADLHLLQQPSFGIVALSRHREECVILHDDEDETAAFVAYAKQSDQPNLVFPTLSPVFPDEIAGEFKPGGRASTGRWFGGVGGINLGDWRNYRQKPKTNEYGKNTTPTSSNVSISDTDSMPSLETISPQPSVHKNYDNVAFSPSEFDYDGKLRTEEYVGQYDDITFAVEQNTYHWKEIMEKFLKVAKNDRPRVMAAIPEHNLCLLMAIGDVTGNSLNRVWESMVSAIGVTRARELNNELWSTDELHSFCVYNGFRIIVICDETREEKECGLIGMAHYFISYTTRGEGHFYVRAENRAEVITPLHFDIVVPPPKPDELSGLTESEKPKSVEVDDEFFDCAEPQEMVNEIIENDIEPTVENTNERFLRTYSKETISKSLDKEIPDPRNIHKDVPEVINNSIFTMVQDWAARSTTQSFSLQDYTLADMMVVDNRGLEVEPTADKKISERELQALGKSSDRPKLVIEFVNKRIAFFDNISLLKLSRLSDEELSKTRLFTLSEFLVSKRMSVDEFCQKLQDFELPHLWKKESLMDRTILWRAKVKNMLRKFKTEVRFIGGAETQIVPVNQLETPCVREVFEHPLDGVEVSFKEMARLFADPVFIDKILVEQEVDNVDTYRPLEQCSFDAFKMLAEDFATVDEYNFVLTNQESLGYLDEGFGNGTFDLTTLDNLNQRGHPKRRTEKAWSLLNVAPGVTYFKNNLAQSLHCLQARYLTRSFMVAFDHKSVEKAREIADLFFNEHMSLNFDVFNEQDLFQTTHESEHAMKIKNYHKQATFDLFGDKDVRFSMKDIFKPFKTKIDLYKAGQGISAWSKDTQTIFQSAFRIINKHFINCLRDHVVYDNGIDEHTLMTRVNGLFSMLPSVAVNGVIDATACDSGQNRFTQMIERKILENLGINEDFLDWYYELRKEYLLKGYGVTAKVKDIKTSGEPATLLNNTILMSCLMNYFLRGEGPAILVIKGDDGLKRQANIQCDPEVLANMKNFLKMDFKIDINVPITFCGYFLSDGVLLPDVVRKCFKILGHRFRDYQHFTEYQQSLRDWVLTVNKIGINDICSVTSTSYDVSYDYVYALLNSIISLTHIGEKQFHKTFIHKEFHWDMEYETGKPWTMRLPWYKGEN
ncbi:putative replicase P1 protein [Red clover RNA virus 1]|nr:putative replicase P1 protein [Red clover RNA virus 1]